MPGHAGSVVAANVLISIVTPGVAATAVQPSAVLAAQPCQTVHSSPHEPRPLTAPLIVLHFVSNARSHHSRQGDGVLDHYGDDYAHRIAMSPAARRSACAFQLRAALVTSSSPMHTHKGKLRWI